MDKYNELLTLVTGLKDDFIKFYDKGNGAAGTRVRKGMQEVAAFAKATRQEVSDIKNAKENAKRTD
jgi:hypothetical protein